MTILRFLYLVVYCCDGSFGGGFSYRRYVRAEEEILALAGGVEWGGVGCSGVFGCGDWEGGPERGGLGAWRGGEGKGMVNADGKVFGMDGRVF